MKRIPGLALVAAMTALFPALARAGDPEIKSVWVQSSFVVDGTADKWVGHLEPLSEAPVLLGVQNDASYLYVCVKTSDPRLKNVLTNLGVTFWVNGASKDDRGYGAHFPVGRQAGHNHVRSQQGLPPDSERAPEERPTPPPVNTDDIELIGPTDEDRFQVKRSPSDPIQAALGDDSGVMVIEMRFPLAGTPDRPLAVDAKPGARIAVGLETERPRRRPDHAGSGGEGGEGGNPEGGAPGGGSGGYGGGHGGGMGGYGGHGGGGMGGHGGGHRGGMSEGRSDMPKLVKVWTRVTLATPPAPAAAPAAAVSKLSSSPASAGAAPALAPSPAPPTGK